MSSLFFVYFQKKCVDIKFLLFYKATMRINTKKIRFELKRLGWTPYRLSKEMKMANQTVYKILNSDGTGYTFRTVERFAKALKMNERDIIQ